MAEQENYYIRVPHGPLVEVAEEVYRAYHQEERRGRTLEEKDQRNGLVSYDGLDTGELTGQDINEQSIISLASITSDAN